MISVLICTWNRGDLIDATLRSIIEESESKANEIVVVNGGGVHDCSATLAAWKLRCPYLREVKILNTNLANSRNIGLREVKGDLVLMTDDDARPFPDWIEKMAQAHAQYPNAGVIGGSVVDASGDTLLSRIADVTTFPRHQEVREVHNVPGVNCSYKRSVIEALGEQDVRMFRGEDVDYNWRAIKAGWKVLYVPDIKVYHAHRPTWKGLFHQHHMYGRAYYRVREKWQDLYCGYPRHLKTPRMWLKGIYYLLSPWWYAYVKARLIAGIFDSIKAYFIICTMSYYTMYGTGKQWWIDRKQAAK